jgi:putative Ca2+/H+ antiporter (TMEM165/GDT1 family)
MDFRVLLTTFGIIFLAEMGDKTQLAAMTMSAQTKKPWAVFIGASLALAAVSALGVIVGGVLGEYLPLEWVKRIAAVAFIVIGVLMLAGKF